jgi:hypothetical protein
VDRPYRIAFALGGLDTDLGPKALATSLEALTWTHALFLSSHPEVPALADLARSKALRYEPKTSTVAHGAEQDTWQDVPVALSTGKIGNRDAVAWAAAEERVRRGVYARPVILAREGGPGLFEYRAVLRMPDGTVRDVTAGQGWAPVGSAAHADRERIEFSLGIFNGDSDRATSHAILQCLLDALTDIDTRYLFKYAPVTPLLHHSNVVYQEEPPGQEDWQDINTCLRLGVADCDDFSPWRAAEHRALFGQNARAMLKDSTRYDGQVLYHIMTVLPDGRVEDPSRARGMR